MHAERSADGIAAGARPSFGPLGLLALDGCAVSRRPAWPRQFARAGHERRLPRPFDRLELLVHREDAEAPERGELIADVRLEQLGPVGVDREAHLVALERVEDPTELLP